MKVPEPTLRGAVVVWLKITGVGLALLLILVGITAAITPDFGRHLFGLTSERVVTVTGSGEREHCGGREWGERLTVTWDEDGPRTSWWQDCPGRVDGQVGEDVRLWVSPGHRAYDYSPQSWWLEMPAMIPVVTLVLTLTWWIRAGRRGRAEHTQGTPGAIDG